MDFKTLKFGCNDIGYLIPDAQASKTATPLQLQKALQALDKENYLALTATDIENILLVVDKHLNYSSEKVSSGTKSFLTELYGKLVYGIGNIESLEQFSSRRFQFSGTKSEKYAIQMLSEMDDITYEKNKDSYENDFYVGKPDILLSDSVKEIKTVYNLSNFLLLNGNRPNKNNLFQLQAYLDILDYETGELVYVLTGMPPDEKQEYLNFAKEKYKNTGISDQEVGRRLKKLEANISIDHIPVEKRIIRKNFKKNPYMIRLARKKVTAARAFLAKIDSKFNNIVDLSGDSGEQAENI